jgi:hypothetical protein
MVGACAFTCEASLPSVGREESLEPELLDDVGDEFLSVGRSGSLSTVVETGGVVAAVELSGEVSGPSVGREESVEEEGDEFLNTGRSESSFA